MLDNMANLLSKTSSIVLVQQAKAIAALPKDQQLGFLINSLDEDVNIGPVVQDLLTNKGGKINDAMKKVITNMEKRYNQAKTPAEKKAILAHLTSIRLTVRDDLIVKTMQQVVLNPFRDDSGRLITKDPAQIVKVIHTGVAQRNNNDVSRAASTKGDRLER